MPGDVGAAPTGVGSGRDLQIARMNAGLMTTTVMSAVVVFLAGALLAAHASRPEAARELSRRDHMRVCRTIKFGNEALLAFRGVPRTGVSRDAQAQVPKECR